MQTTSLGKRARLPGTAGLAALTAGMAAAALVVHIWLVPAGAVGDAPYLIPWWALAAAFALFELAVVRVNGRRDAHSISLSDVPLVFGLLLASPPALLLGRLTGSAAAMLWQRKPPVRLAFNLALHYLETVAAVALLRHLLGAGGSGGPAAWLAVLGAHAVATVVGAASVAAAIRIVDRRRTVGEVARSMQPGFAISIGAGVVALLFLIASRSDSWALLVVAIVVSLLYGAMRLFGSLSDRHTDLRSVYAFASTVSAPETPEAVSDAALRMLSETFRTEVVEVAARHSMPDGTHWFYARLEGGRFLAEPGDADALEALVREARNLGMVPVSDAPGALARILDERGFVEGLVNGFRPNGLSGVVIVANRVGTGRSFAADRDLFTTLTTQMIANLERVALVERLRSEIAMKEHQRLHDALTGLPNRTGFMEYLEASLRDGTGRVAVAVVDLDRFQEVNDVFGPDRADAILVEVAERLRAGLRQSDVVARIGGDEFAVVFHEVRGVDATVALAQRIGDAFTVPFEVGGSSLRLSQATGLAAHPEHGSDAATLLRRANMAKSVARSSRVAIEVFDADQDRAAERRLMLVNDLRQAIEAGEIELHYQPKVAMASGRTIGFEALARWNHPRLGAISPQEFVGLAQRSGLISALTREVLEQALSAAARWRRLDASLTMSVNLAPAVLADDDFADLVRGALERHRLPAEALVLEITESQNLGNDRATRDSVLRLAAAGVILSIDDFGTGYAALSYLQDLPVGEVKIDRSLVARIAEHPGDLAIVSGTVRLVHSVGLRVVAEGVETREVWDLLQGLGCYGAQGYLISPPLTMDRAEAWVSEPGWLLEAAVAVERPGT